jgi:hypothetical protein
MRKQRLIIFFTLAALTVAAGIVNWYARKRLADSYSVQYAYNQLYLNEKSLYINSLHTNQQEQLVIEFNKKLNKAVGNCLQMKAGDNKLVINAKDADVKWWLLFPKMDTARFTIVYANTAIYQSAGNSVTTNFSLKTKIPFYNNPVVVNQVWHYGYDKDLSETEKKTAQRYLADSFGIEKNDNSYKKIEKIFAHLFPYVKNTIGIPHHSVENMQTMTIVEQMKKKQIKLWCGNYTRMLGFFAAQAGLEVRTITTETDKAVSFDVHSFNEIFIPEEGKWCFTDLMNGVAYINSVAGVLNTVDINQLLLKGVQDNNIKALCFKNSTADTCTFGNNLPAGILHYFAGTQQFRFYFSNYLRYQKVQGKLQRIKNFIIPTPTMPVITTIIIIIMRRYC